MHHRLAKEFARIEKKYKNSLSEEKIYNLIKNFKYIIPQGGSMSGIGNDLIIQSISNCFVIGNPSMADSYGGIMKIDEEQLQLCKRRGGVGHDLSDLRPSGANVTNSASSSSGIASFMERYSNSTREVGQHNRRGALMLTVSIKHPDAENFINIKIDTSKVTGANCSVKLTDEFLNCVKTGSPYLQTFPINASNLDLFGTVDKVDLDTLELGKLYYGKKINTYYRLINAKDLWKKIIHNAHKSAEPGVLFWDTILRESPADCYPKFQTVSTNPCEPHCMAI
jgi:ribonucleoside-diphosphate reductase alpha chain